MNQNVDQGQEPIDVYDTATSRSRSFYGPANRRAEPRCTVIWAVWGGISALTSLRHGTFRGNGYYVRPAAMTWCDANVVF